MTKLKIIISLFLIFFSSITFSVESKGIGALDKVVVNGGSPRIINAIGWVGVFPNGDEILGFNFYINDKKLESKSFKRFARGDVDAAYPDKSWKNSGFDLKISIPDEVGAGKYKIALEAITLDQNKINIGIDNKLYKYIVIEEPIKNNKTKKYIFYVIFGLIFIFNIYLIINYKLFFQYTNKKFKLAISELATIHCSILSVFLVLVLFGVTGSSMQLLYENNDLISPQSLPSKIAFNPQPIRSDEWMIQTASAIAQYNHQPKFPIINERLGSNGQNMLISPIGLIPVMHISSIAKPATWGFFVFNLQQALSWQWWLPFFGCLLSLWWLLRILIPNRIGLSFFISLTFCISANCIGWSGWTQYAVLFPTIALCSFINILKRDKLPILMVNTALLVVSLSGFILYLYPPYLIGLSWLYLILLISVINRDYKLLNINSTSLFFILFSLIISILIVFMWWSDSKDAINIIQNTIYPGHRKHELGGSISFSYLLRGYTNAGSLFKLGDNFSNYSEISSFYYFLLPLIVMAFYQYRVDKKGLIFEFPIILYILFIFLYMIKGIPESVSKYTLFEFIPPARLDPVLGLSCAILTALILGSYSYKSKISYSYKIISVFISFAWVVILGIIFLDKKEYLVGFTFGTLVLLGFYVFISSYWLMIGKVKNYLSISIVVCLAYIPFNPISFAPSEIKISDRFSNLLDSQGGSKDRRILVVGSQVPAMSLLSAGISVFNGVLNYPQMEMWKKLKLSADEIYIVNRYQHLIFIPSDLVGDKDFKLVSPQPDVVNFLFNPAKFNFNILDADIVVLPKSYGDKVVNNKSLIELEFESNWKAYKIDRNK